MTCDTSDTSVLLPRKVEVDVSKYHACHVKRRWMSQSATPAMQSATPATQSAATCRQVPRLPCKKPRRPRQHLRTKRAAGASPMPYVPGLPRKVEVDGSKYYAILRLPRETKVDVSKCHACHAKCSYCHAKCSYMSPSATPATQKASAPTATPENQARRRSQPDAIRATPATQSGSRFVQVPRLPRETKADVSQCHACHAKCHACHAKCSYMSPSATPATQKAAAPTATPIGTKRAAGASPMP